jgi:hypothetical protein
MDVCAISGMFETGLYSWSKVRCGVWHMPIRIVDYIRTLILSCIRTRTHKDSWNAHKPIRSCPFHSVSEVSAVTITSLFCWTSDVFPLKRDNDHFPTSTADIYKMLNTTSKFHRPSFLDVLVLRLTGNYISVADFVILLVDVALGLYSEFVVSKYSMDFKSGFQTNFPYKYKLV